MSLYLIFSAMIIAASSGVPGLFFSKNAAISQRIAFVLICISSLLGLTGSVITFIHPENNIILIPWIAIETIVIGIDALSAFFLVPIFLMGTLGAAYGLGYWPQSRHPANSRKLVFFWGFLIAGMTMLVISKHALAFLLGWEIMALSAFFLVATEDNRPESQSASWVYLVATHVGTLTLFGLFILWKQVSGSYMFEPVENGSISFTVMNILFFMALLGFGIKAGIMPFHFWLPAAHASAPTHISAMLSGVVLKTGIYGLVRWLSLFPSPPYAWGTIVLIIGFVSGLFGVVFAIAQHDLKRLLAYHSVENIGIIMMGLGIALLGRSAERPELVILGMAGCLLHVWNHSFFKSLLFFGAGAVIHSTHTRQIDRLGGLAKGMPVTAALFLIGAVAICGLPPLNGFVSELFVYLGMFRMVTDDIGYMAAAVGVPVLAMIGALAAACFVKVYGAVFLGNPRTDLAMHAHEATLCMRIPMIVLAIICVVIGCAPFLFSSILTNAIFVWNPAIQASQLSVFTVAPLSIISILAIALILGVFIITAIFLTRRKKSEYPQVGTWDCGYLRPVNSMEYTASSFARSIVTTFQWVLCPHEHKPDVSGLFPKTSHFSSHIDEVVLDRMLLPSARAAIRWSSFFRRFQQGIIQYYIFYIVIILFVLLCTQMPLKEMFLNWFTR